MTFLLVMLAAASWAADPNTLTPQEKREGWILLFDGRTMDGWLDPRKLSPPGDSWTLENGCLKANAKPRFAEDLISLPTFRDFELLFDWRISRSGNSGVKYRIQDHFVLSQSQPPVKFELEVERSYLSRPPRTGRGGEYVVAFEYQVTDDSLNRDARSTPKHTAGSLYDLVAAGPNNLRPLHEFNESRIVLRGNHVEHWLNGAKVVDAMLDSQEANEAIHRRWGQSPHILELLLKQPRRDCPISLQNHGDDAWFRNIKIRPLR